LVAVVSGLANAPLRNDVWADIVEILLQRGVFVVAAGALSKGLRRNVFAALNTKLQRMLILCPGKTVGGAIRILNREL
jgi:hypothetical protein